MRAARWVLAVLVGGFLVGSCLAWLPHGENDICSYSRIAPLREGGEFTQSSRLWPPRVTCIYENPGEPVRRVLHGPSIGETLAWVVAAVMLFGLVVARRRSALARGAAGAVAYIGLIGFLYYFAGDFAPAGFFSFFVGPPLVAAVDGALRPREDRSLLISLTLGTALAPIVAFTWFLPYALSEEEAGVVIGAALGGFVALAIEAARPRLEAGLARRAL